MHGVPSDLPALRDFHGSRLVAADDLENIVYFRFAYPETEGEIEVGVEGAWRLRGPSGEIVAEGSPSLAAHSDLLPLNAIVAASGTRPPDVAFLSFATGHALEFIDNSTEYESFCIPHAKVYI
jgi:hypothetical protein